MNNYSGKKIVVIDDDNLNIKIVNVKLRPYNLTVDSGISAEKLFSLLENNSYDLILLDNMMPEMEGIIATLILRGKTEEKDIELQYFNRNDYEATFEKYRSYYEKYRINPYTKPIVVLTGDTKEKNVFLNAGFDDYIAKPIETSEFNRIVEKYLEC